MKVIKFSATWCAPCKVFANTFNAVKEKYSNKGIDFLVYDVEEDEKGVELAEKYGIRGVPTVIFADDDFNKIDSISGNVPLKYLDDAVSKFIS